MRLRRYFRYYLRLQRLFSRCTWSLSGLATLARNCGDLIKIISRGLLSGSWPGSLGRPWIIFIGALPGRSITSIIPTPRRGFVAGFIQIYHFAKGADCLRHFVMCSPRLSIMAERLGLSFYLPGSRAFYLRHC